MKMIMRKIWTRTIGWCFVLLSPFTGGMFLLLVAAEQANLLTQDQVLQGLGYGTVAWAVLFMAWFDGSDYQKNLI